MAKQISLGMLINKEQKTSKDPKVLWEQPQKQETVDYKTVLPRTLVTWYQHLSKYIHTARPISKFYRGRWSLGTKIRRRTSTLCSSHLQVLPRALVTWYLNSSKDIHTVLVPFASSTEGAGHLVPKFVEGHPHCARPISKFYRGRWSLVLPRALVTWYINSSKDIHTVLVPFPSSTEGAGHLVHKFVEGHPHCARPICKFYRGRWSLGTKIRRRTSTLCSSHLQVLPRALVTWYINSSKDIHTVLVPFASSTEDAGHLVSKFVEVHPHSSSHLQVLLRALVTWYQNSSKDIHTVLVPFASSTEDAGHLVPKFVEVHPHSSSHLQVLLRALVTWYQNSSKDIHTVLVPFASSTEGAGHLVHKFVEGHPHCARPICKFYRGRWSLGSKIQTRKSAALLASRCEHLRMPAAPKGLPER
ncbi:hypothetical protein J6590_032091 [Homalodisca vitripennis]|nr:hypothetical protein J6590_032091 [Homalodisca vitripennis]